MALNCHGADLSDLGSGPQADRRQVLTFLFFHALLDPRDFLCDSVELVELQSAELDDERRQLAVRRIDLPGQVLNECPSGKPDNAIFRQVAARPLMIELRCRTKTSRVLKTIERACCSAD